MTMRMTDMGLVQNGYKKVAQFKVFEKQWQGWFVWSYTCWKKSDTECIVRVTNSQRFNWLNVFSSRDEANAYIKSELAKAQSAGKSWKREF